MRTDGAPEGFLDGKHVICVLFVALLHAATHSAPVAPCAARMALVAGSAHALLSMPLAVSAGGYTRTPKPFVFRPCRSEAAALLDRECTAREAALALGPHADMVVVTDGADGSCISALGSLQVGHLFHWNLGHPGKNDCKPFVPPRWHGREFVPVAMPSRPDACMLCIGRLRLPTAPGLHLAAGQECM